MMNSMPPSGKRLGTRPRCIAAPIAGPDVGLRKLPLHRLEQRILLHGRLVEFLQVVHIEYVWISVDPAADRSYRSPAMGTELGRRPLFRKLLNALMIPTCPSLCA